MASLHFQPKTIPRGDSLYYALLTATPNQRQGATVLYTFCQEMKNILANAQEVEVTKAKLNWWQQEIARLYAMNPQHPLSHALLPVIQEFGLAQKGFQDLIEGTKMKLSTPYFETQAELQAFYENTGGAINSLYCQLFSSGDNSIAEFTRLSGMALTLIHLIRNFGQDIRQGKFYFSQADLSACGLTLDELFHQAPSESAIQALLQTQAQKARDYYLRANDALPEKSRLTLAASLVFANIYFSLLDEMQRDNFPVLNQQYKLTPLLKLWISWRTRYCEKKRAKRFSKFISL